MRFVNGKNRKEYTATEMIALVQINNVLDYIIRDKHLVGNVDFPFDIVYGESCTEGSNKLRFVIVETTVRADRFSPDEHLVCIETRARLPIAPGNNDGADMITWCAYRKDDPITIINSGAWYWQHWLKIQSFCQACPTEVTGQYQPTFCPDCGTPMTARTIPPL